MRESKKISISFSKAKEVLDEYRYKPRREWSKEERFFFKICNFVVLSKKRVNKIFSAINSFGKLSDKSHYNYNEFDIRLEHWLRHCVISKTIPLQHRNRMNHNWNNFISIVGFLQNCTAVLVAWFFDNCV